MHWFDRMSKQLAAAPEARATRRGAIKGAALAAVAAPLVSDSLAYAGIRMEAFAAQSACLDCLAYSTKLNRIQMDACAVTGKGGPILSASQKKKRATPKKKDKLKPWEGAKDTACQANARINFYFGLEKCRKETCAPQGPLPNNPGPTGGPGGSPGQSSCAPGTTLCGTQLCCYGGDACCACPAAGGMICCAGVIGCTCC